MYLPVGKKDDSEEDLPPNVERNISIKYHQSEDEATCLFNSVASALYYLTECKQADNKFAKLGEEIYNIGQENQNVDFHTQFDLIAKKMASRETLFVKEYTALHVKYVKKEKKKVKYDIMDQFDVTTNNITIVVPIAKYEKKTHAFCLLDKYIFDSSSKYAMLKTKEGIDWCCNGTCKGIQRAYRFFIKKNVFKNFN